MKLGSTLLWALAVSSAAGTLFWLKYQVQGEEQRLVALNREIADTREAMHVLDAEWAYLNDPSRLSEEASSLLGLQPVGPAQIGAIAQIPLAAPRQPATINPPTPPAPTPDNPPPIASAPPPVGDQRALPASEVMR